MSRATLFPGQGAQFPGMGRDLVEKYPVARDLFRRADDVLGFGLTEILFEGSDSCSIVSTPIVGTSARIS